MKIVNKCINCGKEIRNGSIVCSKKCDDEFVESLKMSCDGEACLHPKEMERWEKELRESDGNFPDPIDNSPCDHCIKSKKKVVK